MFLNEFIQHEIDEVTAIINKAESIKRNAKMTALKQAVEKAFVFQNEAGIKQRIVVFTESIRTQQYMFEELSHISVITVTSDFAVKSKKFFKRHPPPPMIKRCTSSSLYPCAVSFFIISTV